MSPTAQTYVLAALDEVVVLLDQARARDAQAEGLADPGRARRNCRVAIELLTDALATLEGNAHD